VPDMGGPAPRVLLVDDDLETSALLRSLLEGEGIEVLGSASDGRQVVESAARLRPDVVLMDLRMPGMDGFEATSLLKARFPWIQVIFLTFYDELLPDRSPQEVGAFAYLVKGCSVKLMRDVIHQAWRHRMES
jgi:CheY-like chemotaxis protein